MIFGDSSQTGLISIGNRTHLKPDSSQTLICANAGYSGPGRLDGDPDGIQKQVDVLCIGVIWTFTDAQPQKLAGCAVNKAISPVNKAGRPVNKAGRASR